MKIDNIFTHKLKSATRSPMLTQSIMGAVAMLLIIAYLVAVVLFLSLNADMILQKIYAGQDLLPVFTGLLFYYFIYDLVLRFLFQDIPTLEIKPYLSLPIKKSKLIHYVLRNSLFSIFNLLGLLLIVPFFIKNIAPEYSLKVSVLWLLTILSLVFINNYFTVWLKRLFIKRPLLIVSTLVVFVAAALFEVFSHLPLSVKFSNLILEIIDQPYYIGLPIVLAFVLYLLAYKTIFKAAYIEDSEKKKSIGSASAFSFLKQYGEVGNLIALELKLIVRNKRPRSLAIISIAFLLYGFMFYSGSNLKNDYMLLLAGVFMTSGFSMNYGQFLFSWESSFFDFINTRDMGIQKYINSKYILFTITSIATYLLTLPYALIDSKIAIINTALVIFSIGYTNMLIIALAAFNSSAIDLGRSQMMNYQGVGAIQYLKIVPLFGIPALIIYLFSLLNITMWAYAFLALIGIVCLIFKDYFLGKIALLLQKRKHKILVGFRQG